MDRVGQLQGKNKKLSMSFMGFITIILLTTLTSAMAHFVSVWAEFKYNRVEVKAYGSDGTQLKTGRVVVKSLDDKLVIEGRIGKNGLFTFVPIRKQDLVITVFLDQGHHGEFWVTEEDFVTGSKTLKDKMDSSIVSRLKKSLIR